MNARMGFIGIGSIIVLLAGGCPGVTQQIDEPRILIFEDIDTSGGTGTVVLPGSNQVPRAGDVVVATGSGGMLRRVNAVSTNSDGSVAVQVAPVTIAEAAQNGDFTFTDGPLTDKKQMTAKTWEVLTFAEGLDRTVYDRSGVLINTDGDFAFDVMLDLDIQVRDARIRYFRSAIEGSADFQLDGDIEALAGIIAETGDITIWSGSRYLYGYIGVFPFGLPVVIEA